MGGKNKMNHAALYLGAVLIWGSTWWVITFQFGVVDPMLSVTYRFFIAALLLFAYCRFAKLDLHFSWQQHLFMALQGMLLFGLNYWIIYLAQVHLTSGLVAVLFSTILIMNILNSAWLLGKKIELRVVIGAVLGMFGIGLVFLPEFKQLSMHNTALWGLGLALFATLLASLGNITSARNQANRIPVVQSNAYGMLYGSLILGVIALITGKTWTFDWSLGYILSMLYLCVFGSILAFGFYLTLVGRIGADKAAYAILLVPIVALIFSTVLEGYVWSAYALVGVGLILSGNLLVLLKVQHWQWLRSHWQSHVVQRVWAYVNP